MPYTCQYERWESQWPDRPEAHDRLTVWCAERSYRILLKSDSVVITDDTWQTKGRCFHMRLKILLCKERPMTTTQSERPALVTWTMQLGHNVWRGKTTLVFVQTLSCSEWFVTLRNFTCFLLLFICGQFCALMNRNNFWRLCFIWQSEFMGNLFCKYCRS